MLTSHPSHGYDLTERLAALGISGEDPPDPGSVYRYLRRLEDEGFLTSVWDTECPGPAKRSYTVTDCGKELLAAWVTSIRAQARRLSDFVALYDQLNSDK